MLQGQPCGAPACTRVLTKSTSGEDVQAINLIRLGQGFLIALPLRCPASATVASVTMVRAIPTDILSGSQSLLTRRLM